LWKILTTRRGHGWSPKGVKVRSRFTAKSLRDLTANPESKALDHMEWLGILLEHEMTLRQQKRFEARARTAKLRHLASVEDIDYRAARGLDRTLFLKLAHSTSPRLAD
jgi:DNA replication protein DnaC